MGMAKGIMVTMGSLESMAMESLDILVSMARMVDGMGPMACMVGGTGLMAIAGPMDTVGTTVTAVMVGRMVTATAAVTVYMVNTGSSGRSGPLT